MLSGDFGAHVSHNRVHGLGPSEQDNKQQARHVQRMRTAAAFLSPSLYSSGRMDHSRALPNCRGQPASVCTSVHLAVTQQGQQGNAQFGTSLGLVLLPGLSAKFKPERSQRKAEHALFTEMSSHSPQHSGSSIWRPTCALLLASYPRPRSHGLGGSCWSAWTLKPGKVSLATQQATWRLYRTLPNQNPQFFCPCKFYIGFHDSYLQKQYGGFGS